MTKFSLLNLERRYSALFLALFLSIATLTVASPEAKAAVEIEAELASIPETAQTAEGFIPVNWQLERKVKGDLNKDGLEDLVLLITRRESESCFAEDLAKAVIVTFQDKNVGLRKVALNTDLARLDCSLMSDIVVLINSGKLQIQNSWGSREVVTEIYSFRYNPRREKLELIGFDRYQCDRLTMNGKEESHNLITGEKIFELVVDGNVVSSKRTRESKEPLKLFGSVVANSSQ